MKPRPPGAAADRTIASFQSRLSALSAPLSRPAVGHRQGGQRLRQPATLLYRAYGCPGKGGPQDVQWEIPQPGSVPPVDGFENRMDQAPSPTSGIFSSVRWLPDIEANDLRRLAIAPSRCEAGAHRGALLRRILTLADQMRRKGQDMPTQESAVMSATQNFRNP